MSSTTPPLREIWLGPLLGKQRALLIERCRERLRQGRGSEILYIAASRPLMLEVYDQMVDGLEIRGNIGSLPIHLFTGLMQQILKSARISLPGGTDEPLPRRDRIDIDQRPLQRPLLSQVMAQLASSGRIPHFGALAKSDGCVESVADLIGEIQRAGKASGAFRLIVEDRIRRAMESFPKPEDEDDLINGLPPEVDAMLGYERDVALIYECYQSALYTNGLTDINEDHLRVLQVLDGEYEGYLCHVPYLKPVRLMVVDGFFDFTPAQGEILKRLIARTPEVFFNFDYDVNNRDVFRPIDDTLEHVEKMADHFERRSFHHIDPTAQPISVEEVLPGLDPIRQALFNTKWETPTAEAMANLVEEGLPITVFEAPDREREVRAVAKEIKSLVRLESFQPFEIAVVVRNKEAYGQDLRRIFSEEGIAYALDERLKVSDIPAVRAVRKLLDAAASRHPDDTAERPPRIPVGKLVGLLKSDYFHLQGITSITPDSVYSITSPTDLTVDDIENIVAFVGQQLHLDDWLSRSAKLLGKFDIPVTGKLIGTDQPGLPFEELNLYQEFFEDFEETLLSTDPHPRHQVRADAVIPWQIFATARVLAVLGRILLKIPYESLAQDLVIRLNEVLTDLQFKAHLEQALKEAQGDPEKMLRATLDLRGSEAINRAMAAVQDAVSHAAEGIRIICGGGSAPLKTKASDPNEATKRLPRLRITTFRDELGRSLENLPLRVQPETFGAVRILEATDVRGLTFRAVFVLGLVEGGFPIRGRADWIYPPAEREQLKEYGLTLEDISPAVMRKEEHYFYQIVNRATERLYLSFPKNQEDDTEAVKSYFLTELERVYPAGLFELEPAPDTISLARPVPKGYDGSQILESTTVRELARASTALRRRLKLGESPDDFAISVGPLTSAEVVTILEQYTFDRGYVSKLAQRRLEIEAERYGSRFGTFDGRMESDIVRSAVANQFGEDRVYSATEFNEYGQCPFRFFAHRVLDLRPRVEAALDLQNQDRGLLLHEILREFFSRLRGKSLSEIGRDKLLVQLKKTAEDVFNNFETRLPPLNPKLWEIERSVLILQLEQVVDYEMDFEDSAARPVRPRFGELAFGMSPRHRDPASLREPLLLTSPNGEIMRLRGQIDRVDVSEDGKLVAYDYKTSRGASINDMRAGRDVQMAIYLEALERLFCREEQEVIGGGYYSLRPGSDRRNNGLYRADFSAYTGLGRTASNLSDDDWQATRKQLINYVWRYWHHLRDGDFRVRPAQNELTCQYCDYKAVCRFDRYRIQKKKKKVSG